jgi:sulfate adenylyltransferase
VPDNFSRPEVLAVLRNYYEGLEEHQKHKVELTGHSAK